VEWARLRGAPLTEIAGRTALVTGGGSGIGRALSMALAAEGASVVVVDILGDRAIAVAQEILDAGGTATGILCDVSDRSSLMQLRTATTELFGPVSLLFANAGISIPLRPLWEASTDDIDWIFSVNLLGVVYCLETFVPQMVAGKDGHIIATSSSQALIPEAMSLNSAYTSAKTGLIGLMQNLRLDLMDSGVESTILCPGATTTQIGQSSANRPARFGGATLSDAKPQRASATLEEAKLLQPWTFQEPEKVAKMTLRAVHNNRPIVFAETDPSWREFFLKTFVDPVLDAFDDAAAFLEEVD
jgi:NAD(P)-dependent dehydrogenase (short-subunit alcohol dehydrogenase family)